MLTDVPVILATFLSFMITSVLDKWDLCCHWCFGEHGISITAPLEYIHSEEITALANVKRNTENGQLCVSGWGDQCGPWGAGRSHENLRAAAGRGVSLSRTTPSTVVTWRAAAGRGGLLSPTAPSTVVTWFNTFGLARKIFLVFVLLFYFILHYNVVMPFTLSFAKERDQFPSFLRKFSDLPEKFW